MRETPEIIWQLPVKQSDKTNHDWVHPRANYHAFRSNRSLCGKYGQDTDFFETNMPDGSDRKHMCKECLKAVKVQDAG